jgi:hypothetical protein
MKLNYHDGYAFLHTLLEEGFSPTVHRWLIIDEHDQVMEEKEWHFDILMGPRMDGRDIEQLKGICDEVGATLSFYPTKRIDLDGEEQPQIKALVGY